MSEARMELAQIATDLGLTVAYEYVKHKYPKDAKPSDFQRKWLVTIHKGDRLVLTSDYFEGCGHCDAHPKGLGRLTVHDTDAIRRECEDGPRNKTPKHPLDALWHIAMDCMGVENTAGFEEWAGEYGYDTDSIKALKIWQEINGQYHAMKCAIGHEGIERLAAVEL